ncbi:MAG: hypothetical protein ACOYL6_14310 [Bacteriovoracaceae bacterium]
MKKVLSTLLFLSTVTAYANPLIVEGLGVGMDGAIESAAKLCASQDKFIESVVDAKEHGSYASLKVICSTEAPNKPVIYALGYTFEAAFDLSADICKKKGEPNGVLVLNHQRFTNIDLVIAKCK